MIRRVAAILVALTVFPAVLYAQETALTVTVQSADVHTGPSTGTPVIGHASRGTALPVVRNLGSWVQVAWVGAPDGLGYVHTTMGRLNVPTPNVPASNTPARTRPTSGSASTSTTPPAPVPLTTTQRTPAASGLPPQQSGSTISHIVGVGGMLGSMSSFGATARWWRHNHLGVQVGATRDSIRSEVTDGRVTSMQIEPGVVYALFDRVRDYVWVRPYVGSAVSFRHATLKVPVPDLSQPTSDNNLGFRVFGGGELTFATATQFGVSAEVGYRRLATPFPGFEADRMSVSIAGHWYFK